MEFSCTSMDALDVTHHYPPSFLSKLYSIRQFQFQKTRKNLQLVNPLGLPKTTMVQRQLKMPTLPSFIHQSPSTSPNRIPKQNLIQPAAYVTANPNQPNQPKLPLLQNASKILPCYAHTIFHPINLTGTSKYERLMAAKSHRLKRRQPPTNRSNEAEKKK